MKKALAMILALAMCLCLFAACGNEPAAPAAPADPAAPAAPADPAAPAEPTDDRSDWVKLDLTLATYLTDTNPCQENIDVFIQKLDEKMPGYITITEYANNTLLKGADIYDGVLNGTCDIGLVQQDYTPARFPLSQLFSYPGIVYNSAEVATRVFHEWARTSGAPELEGLVVLMGIGSGPYCIYTMEPITSMADLQGKQIRAGGVNADLIAAYGATPVSMDISEVYEGLRSSLIDGLYTNYGACAYQNLDDIPGYALVTPLSSNPSMYVMNEDVFNQMPPSQQAVFMEAADETFEEVTAVYQDAGYWGQRVVDFSAKTDRYFLEGELLEEFSAAGAHLMGDLVAELDAAGHDGTGTYNMILELAEKYNSIMTWEDYKACFPPDLDPSNN